MVVVLGLFFQGSLKNDPILPGLAVQAFDNSSAVARTYQHVVELTLEGVRGDVGVTNQFEVP